MKLCLSLVAVCSLLVLASADKDASSGDIRVNVLGKSGRMRIWREKAQGNRTVKTQPMSILFDSLTELSTSGTEVGKTGMPKHSFRSFASQNFAFTSLVDAAVPYSNIGDPASAKMFEFSGQLTGLTSKLTAQVYLVRHDVQVTLGDEVTNITKGQVKINLLLENWEWCAPCTTGKTSEAGAYLDLVITVTSRGKPTERGRGGRTAGRRPRLDYNMGGNDNMQLSEMIKVDGGAWTKMAEGYPKFAQRGGKNMFTFRFPAFQTSLVYDPVFELGSDDSAGTASSTVVLTNLLLALVATLIGLH